ncbi:hypothetical protein JCM10908_001538 [Rhodotorula pacifica]|uniref:uncharacterized protein n=1 Tax=Rhodotorula pacifica TaxID=1495444 RepID=UPI0031708635
MSTRSRSASSASSALPYFSDDGDSGEAVASSPNKNRVMPPPIMVPIPPSRSASPPPQSPAILLSPSTPDFPTCPLPYDAITTVTELVPAKVLPPRRAATDPLPQNEFSAAPPDTDSDGESVRDRLRDSILLLNQRVAEIERIEALHVEASGAYEAGLAGVGRQRIASGPLTLSTETSSTSLASIATSASSEDAFDIADFPSLAQLDSSYNLFDLTAVSTERKDSIDRVAFPFPPAAQPEGSPQRRSTPPPVSLDPIEVARARRLAELEEHQKGSIGLGLGLFTDDTPMPSPALEQSVGASSSRASSISGGSSLSSKSFDASTLDSSAANTSFSGATLHKEMFEQTFPPELSATIPWFAQSPPSAFVRSLQQPIDALSIDIGSAHPALASPFAVSGPSDHFAAPSQTSAMPDASAIVASPQGMTSGSLAVDGLTDALDETGVADWVTGRSPASLLHEELVSQQAEDEQRQQAKQSASLSTTPLPETAPLTFVRPDMPPEPKSIRRFSSLGLLKKRKSEAVLRETTNPQQQAPAKAKTPSLFKRKSDAALNTLMRVSRSRAQDKENAPLADGTVKRPVISAPLSAETLANLPPRRLAKRSASTPKLSKLFASSGAASDKVPDLPAYVRAAATPASADAEADQSMASSATSSKMKKRISMYFDKLSGTPAPPIEQAGKPTSPIRERAPLGISIDVEKANEGMPISRVVSEHDSIASTLEIVSPTKTAPPSALFSEAIPSTATSAPDSARYHNSISSMSAVVHGALFDKAQPSALPPTPFSAPPSQTNFVFPTGSLAAARTRKLSVQEHNASARLSIAGFLRTDALDSPNMSGEPAAKSPPHMVFPMAKSPTPQNDALLSVSEADEEPIAVPTTTALLNAMDLAYRQVYAPVPSTDVTAFPFLATIPSMDGSGGGDGGGDSDSGSDDDDYGSRTGSSVEDPQDDEDDRPIGIIVPGALTAQKSLRLSAAKKSRAERKARKNADKQSPAGPSPQREDPFELEGTAAMVNTPPRSRDGHDASPAAHASTSRLLVKPDLAARQRSPSTGHDSLLPQTDASIYRRTVSAGLTRSPSSPLDPVVADSALTIDSPEIQKRSLPSLPASSGPPDPERPVRKGSKDSTLSPRSPTEGHFATTFRSPTTFSPPTLPPQSRPLLPSRTSSATTTPASTSSPTLHRQPSLHPDAHAHSVRRHASSSSAHSSLSHSKGPASVQRTRSTASSSTGVMTEQRIYVDATFGQFLTVPISEKTMAGEVVALAKTRGALPAANPAEGGWALWESWRSLGYERPLREYELVSDVSRSWDVETNALFFRRTTMWPILSAHAREHPIPVKTGAVQIETKDGKWNKRYLRLDDGVLKQCKSERFKDASVLCQLAQFDVFLVSAEAANRHRAPKPYVFALKSRLPKAHFEDSAQWCHLVSTKTPEEAATWVKTVIEAGNPFARQREKAVLGSSPISPVTSPLLDGLKISTDIPRSSSPTLLSPTSFAPPVASSSSAPRHPGRPAPPSLGSSAVRSQTLPYPTSSPAMSDSSSLQGSSGANLSRHNTTVVKPDSRQWGAMGEEERHEWLRSSERAAKMTKTPLVDLSR